ncbi:MAG: FAD:protein FMN transferase [Marinilabilia sp.]
MKKDGNQTCKHVHHSHGFLMNTRLDMVLWGVSPETAESISQDIMAETRKLQQTLDRFDKDAETCRINHLALTEETQISPLLMSAVMKSIDYFHRTKGYFNVFAGNAFSSLKNGDVINSFIHLPPEKAVCIGEKRSTIRFLSQEVSLDFGGIGKGMALDRAAAILGPFKSANAFISFGGSSILTRGRHPHGSFWPFSFRDVQTGEEPWQLNDDAISVSSATTGKSRHHHILDPTSGKGVTNNLTTGVQCKHATDAEVVSTALITAPPQWHEEIIAEFDVKKYKIFNTTDR